MYSALLGILGGFIVFGVRLYDPRGMNLILMAFNRRLVVTIAGLSVLSVMAVITSFLIKNRFLDVILSALVFVSLMYLVPPVIQYTREFVYFGEAGFSTNSMLRASGFSLGLGLCLLLVLSSYEVHRSLRSENEGRAFLCMGLMIYACEYLAAGIVALQRLRVLNINDVLLKNITVFDVLIWRDANPNAFTFAQLGLGLVMLLFVIMTHRHPQGTFPNKASLRKEKARLRDCRRWAYSLSIWGVLAVFIVVVLHYYDTRPPAEIQPEPYELKDNIISVELSKVSDGHLHKFSYVTPNGYDVRFLIVKKPAGSAYGVGLDACDICGVAGYYERGDEEVICRRCDVVMNKNTIGFKGGCNPVPFEYEVREGKIFIETERLVEHERRFR